MNDTVVISPEENNCRACGASGFGKYCNQCGQNYQVKRITLHSLLHDVFHFFTHLDKGFAYTIRQLAMNPGTMQRSYIHGERSKYQAPFSMFFICATIAGLGRYWIYLTLIKYYHEGDLSEANFFHEYLALFQILLLPFIVLCTYILFYRSPFNFAEIGVMKLYSFSFFFLIVTGFALLRFIWPSLDTAYLEFPAIIIYNTLTYRNFFREEKSWIVITKSVATIVGWFLLIQYLEDIFVKMIEMKN